MRFIRHFRGKITAVQQPNFALVSCWIVFADPLRNNSRVVVSPGVIATVTPFLLRRIRAIVTHVELGPWTPRHLRKVKYQREVQTLFGSLPTTRSSCQRPDVS